jgi:hypothetical protein
VEGDAFHIIASNNASHGLLGSMDADYASDLNLKRLREYFSDPLVKAAAKLGICITALKRYKINFYRHTPMSKSLAQQEMQRTWAQEMAVSQSKHYLFDYEFQLFDQLFLGLYDLQLKSIENRIANLASKPENTKQSKDVADLRRRLALIMRFGDDRHCLTATAVSNSSAHQIIPVEQHSAATHSRDSVSADHAQPSQDLLLDDDRAATDFTFLSSHYSPALKHAFYGPSSHAKGTDTDEHHRNEPQPASYRAVPCADLSPHSLDPSLHAMPMRWGTATGMDINLHHRHEQPVSRGAAAARPWPPPALEHLRERLVPVLSTYGGRCVYVKRDGRRKERKSHGSPLIHSREIGQPPLWQRCRVKFRRCTSRRLKYSINT